MRLPSHSIVMSSATVSARRLKACAGRAAMNEPDGYGVFSITPTPRHFEIDMPAGGHALLASDGLMRLVDVFKLYTALDLLSAVRNGYALT